MLKLALLLAVLLPAGQSAPKDNPMHHASGTFEVTMKPEPTAGNAAEIGLGRMSIDKVFHGDIEGTSKGEMYSSGDPAKGEAGYVAIEKVTGKLDGAEGTFVLQHSATMGKGGFTMSVVVVPGSGTGALDGLAGKLEIQIAKGKHSYTFDYTLPAK